MEKAELILKAVWVLFKIGVVLTARTQKAKSSNWILTIGMVNGKFKITFRKI